MLPRIRCHCLLACTLLGAFTPLCAGQGLVLRGRAMDEEGNGVAGAAVSIQGGPPTSFFAAGPVRADEEGRFEFTGITKTGEFLLKVEHADRRLASASKIAVRQRQEGTNVVDLAPVPLQRMGTVTGQVLVDGRPRAGVEVSANLQMELDGETTGYPLQSTKTDANGRYSLLTTAHPNVNIVGNARDLNLNTPLEQIGPHRLMPGETIEVPALQMTALESFVAGVVVDPDGKPLSGVTVSVTPMDILARSAWGGGGSPPTDADGRFRVNGLPNSPLRLMVYIPPPANSTNRIIRFPAEVFTESGQTDVRIIYDPKLKRSLPTRPR